MLPNLFGRVLELYANGADLPLFYGLLDRANDSGGQLPPQEDLFLLNLKSQNNQGVLGRDSTQLDNERSTQGEISDFSPDDMACQYTVQGMETSCRGEPRRSFIFLRECEPDPIIAKQLT